MRDTNDITTGDMFETATDIPSAEILAFPQHKRRRIVTPRPQRKYLTPDEVERLAKAARSIGRHRHRDGSLIVLAFRHGLRVSELVDSR